jgi:hypothetical protein
MEDISLDVLRESRWIYAESYLLAHPVGRDGLFAIAEAARRCGTRVAISLSDPFVVNQCRDDLNRLIRQFADLVIGNEIEATCLTGSEDGLGSIAELLKYSSAACVTLGADGAYLNLHGQSQFIPAFRTRAVDLTGAGDMFAAGVLWGLCKGVSQREAGLIGALLARDIVREMGPRLERGPSGEAWAAASIWVTGTQDREWLSPRQQRTLAAFLSEQGERDGNADLMGYSACQLFWRKGLGGPALEKSMLGLIEEIDAASQRRFAKNFVALNRNDRLAIVDEIAER